MSKTNKSVDVHVNEAKDDQGQSIYNLIVEKKNIGTLKQLEPNKFEAVNLDNEVFHVKTYDEGIATLIKYYNLHH